MLRRWCLALFAGLLGLGLWLTPAAPARAGGWYIGQYFYYPYYYFPHNYWPNMTCWPEKPGDPYLRPPAYMAYPPFHEAHWRYEWQERQSYYRGFHFWLDAF
jgi:hypothetical protein